MASTLLSDFASQVAQAPDFPIAERGKQVWTRSEVDELADRIVRDAPQIDGRLVALHCHNGPHFLAALLALWRQGATVLLLEANTPLQRACELGRAFQCTFLLGVADAWSPPDTAPLGAAENLSWRPLASADSVSSKVEPPSTNGPAAVIKLTSGSTGDPQGIVVTDAALAADESALASTMDISRERILTTIPLSHSYGFSSIALAALRRDATIVHPVSDSPVSALKTLRQADISFFPSVPAWLEAMVGLSGSPETLGSVRLVISAGAPLPADTAQRFLDRFGLPIKTFYGASECGGITFDRTGEAGLSGTLGTPVDGVELAIERGNRSFSDQATVEASDSDTQHRTVGRIRVTSAAIASGYVLPADTETRTLDQDSKPFFDGNSFVTGDLGQIEHGVLAIVGRIDDVINLKGKKVYPSEVERVLISLDGVREAFVFAEAAKGREHQFRLKAIVAADAAIDRADILRLCRQHLASHKMPRSITVVDALPRTARGKLDRAQAKRLSRGAA